MHCQQIYHFDDSGLMMLHTFFVLNNVLFFLQKAEAKVCSSKSQGKAQEGTCLS